MGMPGSLLLPIPLTPSAANASAAQTRHVCGSVHVCVKAWLDVGMHKMCTVGHGLVVGVYRVKYEKAWGPVCV